MPGTDPIRLGSAALLTAFTFETGSRVTTSDSGIQSCQVRALFSDGANIFSNIPPAGTSFNTLFGNAYLPSSFLIDYTDSGPEVEYLEGKIARVTFNFKRQDPTQIGVRKIFVDSTINYDSPLGLQSISYISYSGGSVGQANSENRFTNLGFPEPIVTVRYNSNTRPSIGAGGLSQLYALPGSTNAQGFPAAPVIPLPLSMPVGVGATVTYFDGDSFVTVGPLTHPVTMNFTINYGPDPLGWKLMRLKSDPVAAANFYDVEEEWRTYYFVTSVTGVVLNPPP